MRAGGSVGVAGAPSVGKFSTRRHTVGTQFDMRYAATARETISFGATGASALPAVAGNGCCWGGSGGSTAGGGASARMIPGGGVNGIFAGGAFIVFGAPTGLRGESPTGASALPAASEAESPAATTTFGATSAAALQSAACSDCCWSASGSAGSGWAGGSGDSSGSGGVARASALPTASEAD